MSVLLILKNNSMMRHLLKIEAVPNMDGSRVMIDGRNPM